MSNLKNFFKISIVLVLAIGVALAIQSPVSAEGKGREKPHVRVCNQTNRGDVACNARVIVDSQGKPQTTILPSGYGPAQFLGAYNLPKQVSKPTTIAIIDAYDDPSIASDLNTYSITFGIPSLKSCPASSGNTTTPCFQKISQNGTTRYPVFNSGWALETSLDVEVAHAICQNCNILLVEANSNSYTNLMAAVDRAVAMGAVVVSNSYGSGEFSSETSLDSHFNHPGIAFTFSTGDSGFGAEYPAASKYVTAVGGTTLNVTSSNGYGSESAWSGSGSGCSAYEDQLSWQTALGLSGCTNRMVADVSADADPNTGAAVYDGNRGGYHGWLQVGGTSLASPIVSSAYALSGNTSAGANSIPYSHTNNLNDVIGGSNGTCSIGFLCNGGVGYDGPTGLGSPNTASAF